MHSWRLKCARVTLLKNHSINKVAWHPVIYGMQNRWKKDSKDYNYDNLVPIKDTN